MKCFLTLITLLLISSCGGKITGNHEANLERLDEVYGKCDNPHRKYSKIEKEICQDKERAAGPDGEIGEPISITDMFSRSGNQTIITSSNQINKYLWDASLEVLKSYPMKNIDFEGGFVETDWINYSDLPNQRCLIKSHVQSMDLVSNGVVVGMVCENKVDDIWYLIKDDYLEEEKQITLKILEKAQVMSQENLIN